MCPENGISPACVSGLGQHSSPRGHGCPVNLPPTTDVQIHRKESEGFGFVIISSLNRPENSATISECPPGGSLFHIKHNTLLCPFCDNVFCVCFCMGIFIVCSGYFLWVQTELYFLRRLHVWGQSSLWKSHTLTKALLLNVWISLATLNFPDIDWLILFKLGFFFFVRI